ncbi:hypothetical protein UN63_02595 [Oceanisphaera arctica]|uniref:Uncharacterized protein n=1 Tax=Oceanisphaera arctica TaxID=641510 RepID=A0A2P5TQN7_9GAMM|nr:hypothetical protein UN63_02595 [Oceanisphaera arctica]
MALMNMIVRCIYQQKRESVVGAKPLSLAQLMKREHFLMTGIIAQSLRCILLNLRNMLKCLTLYILRIILTIC